MFPGPKRNPGKERGTDRNRRVSAPLSPIFSLLLAPTGILYQRVQRLLSEEEPAEGNTPPAVIKQRRPRPKQPADGLPASQWPTVLKRVLEKKASLRNVADDSGVSQETIRRVVRAVRCGSKASVRTERPNSHHTEMLLFGKLTIPRTAIHAAFDQLEPIDVPP